MPISQAISNPIFRAHSSAWLLEAILNASKNPLTQGPIESLIRLLKPALPGLPSEIPWTFSFSTLWGGFFQLIDGMSYLSYYWPYGCWEYNRSWRESIKPFSNQSNPCRPKPYCSWIAKFTIGCEGSCHMPPTSWCLHPILHTQVEEVLYKWKPKWIPNSLSI